MRAVLLLIVAACGRIGFVPSDHVDDASSGDAAASTGPVGPRWIKRFGAPDVRSRAAGRAGEVAIIQPFDQTFTGDDGVQLTGQSPFTSSAVVRYSATGAPKLLSVGDSNGFCDLRGIAVDGDDTIVTGLTVGTMTVPSYGVCSIATNRQDPIAFRIAANGAQSLIAHWSAATANAQAWDIVQLSDGTHLLSGIYGASLTIDQPLPTATADPSMWIARNLSAGPDGATWSRSSTGPAEIHAGPLALAGDEVCALGAFRGPSTVLETALPHAGGYDSWMARITTDGTPRYVRALGTPGDESQFGDGSAAATPTGCYFAVDAPGDVTFDGTLLPVSAGVGLIVHLGNDGSLVEGWRVATTPFVAVVGGRLLAAFAVDTALTIGGMPYVPDGSDVVVVELDATGPSRLVGVVGGAGDQVARGLVAIADDAVAITVVSDGALSFGDTSFDTGVTRVRAIASLGL